MNNIFHITYWRKHKILWRKNIRCNYKLIASAAFATIFLWLAALGAFFQASFFKNIPKDILLGALGFFIADAVIIFALAFSFMEIKHCLAKKKQECLSKKIQNKGKKLLSFSAHKEKN